MTAFDAPLPLVPLPNWDDTRLDADDVATWHVALSSAIAPDLPHDLLAIWLYTANGPVLLAPEALAQDDLMPPRAAPHVDAEALDAFRQIFVQARYASTLCQPVAYGRADVALLVLADLREGLPEAPRRALLLDIAQRLAPTFARLARRWHEADVSTAARDATSDLLEALSRAPSGDATPAGVLRSLLGVLRAAVPHEGASILVPGAVRGEWCRLTDHIGGSLWDNPALAVAEETLQSAGVLVSEPTVLAAPAAVGAWGAVVPQLGEPPHSALVTPLRLEGRTVGLLVLASPDAQLYGMTERRLVTQVAPLFAARVEALLLSSEVAAARARAAASQAVPTQLQRLTTMLATNPNLADALREIATEATALLPYRRLRFAIRLGQSDRVAYALPGETRAFADLPMAPIGGSPLESVLLGERPNAVIAAGAEHELVFPLRVSGEVIGAMMLTAEGDDRFSGAHLAIAQQLSDIVAPYLELRRRPYIRAPFAPGWKRSPSVGE